MRSLSLFVLIGLLPPAAAAANSIAVLRVDVTTPDPDLAELSSVVTSALRKRAVESGRFTGVDVPRLSMRELLATIDCVNDNNECTARLGKELGVDFVAMGEISRVEDRYVVSLRLVNVPARALHRQQTDSVQRRDELLARIESLAQRLFAVVGDIRVQANVEGVTVTLDAEPRGETPLLLSALDPGEHQLVASKAGYETWTGTVRVSGDKVAEVMLVMSEVGEPPLIPEVVYVDKVVLVETPSALAAVGVPTWISLSVGVVGMALGAVMAGLTGQTQRDFDGLAVASGDDVSRLAGLRDRGESQALWANVGFAVGGAGLAAGLVLLILDLTAESEGPVGAPATSIDGQTFIFGWRWAL